MLDGADCVIDAGRCVYGVASTVVDLMDMQVLRKGAGYEQVVRCCDSCCLLKYRDGH